MIKPDVRRDVVLFDKDSTLADTTHRRHLTPTNDPTKTWADYSLACLADKPITGVVALINLFWDSGYAIHIVSGADESARNLVIEWLARYLIPYDALRLHGPADPEDLTEYKVNYVEQLRAAGQKPVLFVEDWPPTADALEAVDLPVLRVNPCYPPPEISV